MILLLPEKAVGGVTFWWGWESGGEYSNIGGEYKVTFISAAAFVYVIVVFGTHAGHEVVCTPHARHLVLVEQLLDEALRGLVHLHEDHVQPVDAQQQQGLEPLHKMALKICLTDNCYYLTRISSSTKN